MQNDDQRVLILGLPETGKSSFIQALDEVLKHPPSIDSLCNDGLAHDRSYIQSGKEEFRAGVVPGRTDRQIDDTSVELWFKHPPTGSRGRLYLPDAKGELFLDQWINRQWTKEYRESLRGIAGALLFLRADMKSRNDERLGILTKAMSVAKAIRPWDIKEASAQVKTVDIIQFIAEHGEAPRPLRIAVLISAWDTVGGEGDLRPQEPGKFLEKEWALLAQYLRANPQYFMPKIYGVSAFGGQPGALGDKAELPPHERAQLVEDSLRSNDLTRPVRWLLELD